MTLMIESMQGRQERKLENGKSLLGQFTTFRGIWGVKYYTAGRTDKTS